MTSAPWEQMLKCGQCHKVRGRVGGGAWVKRVSAIKGALLVTQNCDIIWVCPGEINTRGQKHFRAVFLRLCHWQFLMYINKATQSVWPLLQDAASTSGMECLFIFFLSPSSPCNIHTPWGPTSSTEIRETLNLEILPSKKWAKQPLFFVKYPAYRPLLY